MTPTRSDIDALIAEAEKLSETKGPTGDHMIQPFKMLATRAKKSDDEEERDLGEIMDCAMHCIENETLRKLMAEDMLAKLLPLAKLGAAVANPTEEEIEAMARALYTDQGGFGGKGVEWFWAKLTDPDEQIFHGRIERLRRKGRAALAALREQHNDK